MKTQDEQVNIEAAPEFRGPGAPVPRPRTSANNGGRMPAVATVANGACGGCEAPLPDFVIEALNQGTVVTCARCERLLRLASVE